jgi:hypothetical protein
METSQRWLYDFAVCAEREGALELARDAFQRAAGVATQTTHVGMTLSTADGVLARLHLARVLARLGKKAEARAAYDDFLARWGHPDRPLAEIDAARKELAALAHTAP